MKLTEALIAYDSQNGIKVGPWPDETGWADDYIFTTGACYTFVHEMTSEHKTRWAFIEAMQIIIRHGLDPKMVHDAFCEIKEYRKGLECDTPVPKHLRTIFQQEHNNE